MPHVVKKTNKKPKANISEKTASQFVFKSKTGCPINQMSLFQKSLLFSEISLISYLSLEQCNVAAGKLGFTEGKFFTRDGSQAYWFQNGTDSVVVFRGTEAHEWNDIQADANALTAIAETVGKVHRGFKKEVDDLWPYLEAELEKNTKPLWFTGHSLGGAMATICAGRCMLSYIKSEPEGLFTFGSPRVGDSRYINYVKIPHVRWVNNNDIVTRIPPVWLGYRHGGQEMYLDRTGNLRDVTGWRRVSDRIQGLVREFTTKFRIDYLSDHAITDYVDLIFDLVRKEETDLAKAKASAKKSTTTHQAPDEIKTPISENESVAVQ